MYSISGQEIEGIVTTWQRVDVSMCMELEWFFMLAQIIGVYNTVHVCLVCRVSSRKKFFGGKFSDLQYACADTTTSCLLRS